MYIFQILHCLEQGIRWNIIDLFGEPLFLIGNGRRVGIEDDILQMSLYKKKNHSRIGLGWPMNVSIPEDNAVTEQPSACRHQYTVNVLRSLSLVKTRCF